MINKSQFVTEEGFAYSLTHDNEGVRAAKLFNGALVPFKGHEVLTRVEIRECNHMTGTSHDPMAIRAGGEVKIFFSDYQVYRYEFRETLSAVMRLVQVLDSLRSFPVPIWSRERIETHLLNRAVYYREFPALVTDFDGTRGDVLLVADNSEKLFIKEPWFEPEVKGFKVLREDLLSPYIHWHRKAE